MRRTQVPVCVNRFEMEMRVEEQPRRGRDDGEVDQPNPQSVRTCGDSARNKPTQRLAKPREKPGSGDDEQGDAAAYRLARLDAGLRVTGLSPQELVPLIDS